MKWLSGEMADAKWMTWLTRETMENCNCELLMAFFLFGKWFFNNSS